MYMVMFGNRTFKETMGGRTEYEYDRRNRLEMVKYPDRWEKFGYNLAGNRKRRVDIMVEKIREDSVILIIINR